MHLRACGHGKHFDYAPVMKFFAASALAFTLSVASQAQAQEREWSLGTTEKQAFLVFGVPDTDDVGFSFWCDVGKSRVSAFLPDTVAKLRRGERLSVKIDVDGKGFNIPARANVDDGTGKMNVETSFGLKDLLMARLREADNMAIAVKNHVSSFPLADADFDGFVDACNGVDAGN